MSDNREQEAMRPIPDGGLQESMPSWLKRPPAWRNKTLSPEQRFERTLPEPDTSEIDPTTLVSVDDLPQWLQSIAARGPIDLPEPDPAVEHAVEIVQASRHQPVAASVQEPEHGPDLHTEPDPDTIRVAEPSEGAALEGVAEPVTSTEDSPSDVTLESPADQAVAPDATPAGSAPPVTEPDAPSPWTSLGVASIAIVLAGVLLILWLNM